ncbi:YugN-like family [Schinkia azotoformans MEV2011]|uniref:YugN-like family n=1 Tax=Schinkia azotoformans MEV2011 TaxID=1348973 RepID=A0A072NGF2_SCHAZ|nr:YugN family protein [Schinkia azotoformans]KEF35998.1 YugN-like family [Schinkia azotoformans MEV2011]MEC1697992.1 YugN family protein [Schinkia azotoformans]MEC1721054.1 YugN family protein [Schinkia azotoformans]MEC1727212.1 YugN family protein [Schinkia azotoformans]MEC1773471.1 YugN family protein [Schinkia azotoformans]
MRFEGTGLDDKVYDISLLRKVLGEYQLLSREQWDYERISFDRKFEQLDTKEVFYLRVQGYAVEGNVDSNHAKIKLLTPILGKHYYPHGVEYGDDEVIPNNVVEKSKSILEAVSKQLAEAVK